MFAPMRACIILSKFVLLASYSDALLMAMSACAITDTLLSIPIVAISIVAVAVVVVNVLILSSIITIINVTPVLVFMFVPGYRIYPHALYP